MLTSFLWPLVSNGRRHTLFTHLAVVGTTIIGTANGVKKYQKETISSVFFGALSGQSDI